MKIAYILLFMSLIACTSQHQRSPSSLLNYSLEAHHSHISPFGIRYKLFNRETTADAIYIFLKNSDLQQYTYNLEEAQYLELSFIKGEGQISRWQSSEKGVFSEVSVSQPGSYTLALKNQGIIINQLEFVADFKFKRTVTDAWEIGTSNYDERLKGIFNLSLQEDESSVAFSRNDKSLILNGFSIERTFPHSLIPHRFACDRDPKGNSDFLAMRTITFSFKDQAQKDVRIEVRDDTSDFDSRNVQSFYYLFPRKFIPHYRLQGDKQIITLTTGEEVSYHLSEGVFENLFFESPIDYGPASPKKCPSSARLSKKAPTFLYQGKGLVVRVNYPTGNYHPSHPEAEGVTPISGEHGEIGSKGVWVGYYEAEQNKWISCTKLSKKDLFDSQSEFKFPEDRPFADLLELKCGVNFKKKIIEN